jgi:hypothetical protein
MQQIYVHNDIENYRGLIFTSIATYNVPRAVANDTQMGLVKEKAKGSTELYARNHCRFRT